MNNMLQFYKEQIESLYILDQIYCNDLATLSFYRVHRCRLERRFDELKDMFEKISDSGIDCISLKRRNLLPTSVFVDTDDEFEDYFDEEEIALEDTLADFS